jgi:hypothetical protein
MTDAKILELATDCFYKQKTGWSGVSNESIIEFAKVIQDKILEQITLKLEELK